MDKPHSILLVEDNPMDLDLTLRAFARGPLEIKIEVARDGQEALDCIKAWDADAPAPGVILLDINLPKVSGLEVLRQLRAHPRFRCLPVVMLTSSAEDGDVRTAYALGANSYIVKPVDFEKFLAVARQFEEYWLVLNHQPPQASP